MQARNAHEVRDAGDAKHVPITLADGGLVAEQQGRSLPAETRFFQGLKYQAACVLPPLLDGKLPGALQAFQTAHPCTLAHIACGVHALFPQPQLCIKAARVDQTVRAFQAQR